MLVRLRSKMLRAPRAGFAFTGAYAELAVRIGPAAGPCLRYFRAPNRSPLDCYLPNVREPPASLTPTAARTASAAACHDVALLRKIADGDQAAMTEFYRLHSQAVRSHLCLVVGDPA